MPHVLITGGTSGLGSGLAHHYLRLGWRVTTINRRDDPRLDEELRGVEGYVLDVRDHDGVRKLVAGLRERNNFPDLWILSAGINRPDSRNGRTVDYEAYQDVWQINFNGVMIFVDAIRAQAPPGQKLQLVCASSTSIIVGNPRCQAYNMSKLGLHNLFREMDKPGKIRYRSLILGPIRTNIFTSADAGWFQTRAREWLSKNVDEAVPVIAKFLEGHRQALWWPPKAVWTMRALKLALKVAPSVYRG